MDFRLRIIRTYLHYLLVAGFDVYGNFGHQLMTRMFMDFLRLEGESNFLTLPPKRHQTRWTFQLVQNQSVQLSDFLQRNIAPFAQPTNVVYKTADPKRELPNMIKDKPELVSMTVSR